MVKMAARTGKVQNSWRSPGTCATARHVNCSPPAGSMPAGPLFPAARAQGKGSRPGQGGLGAEGSSRTSGEARGRGAHVRAGGRSPALTCPRSGPCRPASPPALARPGNCYCRLPGQRHDVGAPAPGQAQPGERDTWCQGREGGREDGAV